MNEIKTIDVDIGGVNYRLSSDDDYLMGLKNGFEPDMVKLLKIIATDSKVILDVGANIGCTALLFSGLCDKVYAFEPSHSTFNFLRENIENSGKKNIYIENIGLGSDAAFTTLTFSPNNRSGGFVSSQTQASQGHVIESISIRRLDEVVLSRGIDHVDFIKIDVEGFEGHVLRGASETLLKFKPSVVLELNHWCLNAFQRTSIPDFFDFLCSIFPVVYAVDSSCYMNLHDPSDRYNVMYHHILKMRYQNIVAGFDLNSMAKFEASYRLGSV